jgi:hypothetical protein
MNRAPARFGWAALLAAWVLDQLFWEKAPGISFPLWIAVALGVGLLVARSLKVRPAPLSLALMAAALVFASMTFLRREGFTQFINTLLCLGSLALLAGTFRTGNWLFYKIGDYLAAGLRLWRAVLIRPADLVLPAARPAPLSADSPAPSAETAAPAPATPAWKTAGQQAAPVARGLLLALPIVLILGGLLAAADPIFNNWARDLLRVFDFNKLAEYLFRLFYIAILAYVLAGVYLHAVQPGTLEPRPSPTARWFPPILGWVEAVVVLGAVNLLFLVFVSIQFWYLFGGQANISTSGFTYSEYAVRGFNELVMVAVLSLLLYLGVGAAVDHKNPLQQKLSMGLNTLLIAQVLVILVSSFSRLRMYEDAYGFTQLRTYTHILILWMGVLLAATIGLEVTRRRHAFALVALLTACGFGLTFGLLNVDGFIAQQNIQRAWSSGKLDGQYLTILSDDAVPTLLDEFQRPNQPEAVKDILGAELSCRSTLAQRNAPSEAGSSWLSYNLSHATALGLLQGSQALWQAYPVQQTGGLSVKLKSGVHPCRIMGSLK